MCTFHADGSALAAEPAADRSILPKIRASVPARAVAITGLAVAAGLCQARITELVIETVEPLNGGTAYGAAGPYERLRGYAVGTLDPASPANRDIVNLAAAPRDAAGLVEYRVDVEIHRPADPAKGNGTRLYEVVNRGNMLLAGFINQPTPLLMERGWTLVWSGWQADLARTPTNLLASLPVARAADGPIVAQSREEYVDRGTETWTGALQYPAATLDRSQATLTVREREADPRTPVDSWRYVDERTIEVTPPGAPFDAGAIYEFIHPARDPVVAGIGFAATRDVNAFLRYARVDDRGRPNPLAGRGLDRHLVLGISQSGRFLRDFLYQGFNADESGQRVFDGAMPIIPGSRKTWVNFAFAQPGRWSKQHEEHLQPGDQFPFAYPVTRDPLTGRVDGVLARCRASGTCPKVAHVDGEFEVWGARGSLLVSDGAPSGPRPIPMPPDVRLYMVAGTPHGGANRLTPASDDTGICKYVNTPLGTAAVNRAIVLALDDWVAERAEPPPSRYGRVEGPVREGSLVAPDRASTGFPAIPGVTYTGLVNYLHVTDYDRQPPALGPAYALRVPRVDADGNSLAGIRLPALQAPVATYTGWNLRREGWAEDENCLANGAYLPFPRTREERLQTGDPRPSLQERYRTHDRYLRRFEHAAQSLVRQGYLLPDDARRMVDEAEALDLGLPRRP